MIKNYLSLIKFSHTIFAMPFALLGMMLGFRDTQMGWSWLLFVQIVGAMILARSAAMAFNRFLDADIDTANPRTNSVREIPRGIISRRSALIFVTLTSFAFVLLTWTINSTVFWLSPIALGIILGYSYTKRFTAFCHAVLGLGLALAPIGAYLAVTAVPNWVPVVIALSVLLWVTGFDIIYALQDEQFDAAQGLYSIPTALGANGALRVSRMLHALSVMGLAGAGLLGGFGWMYALGWVIFMLMIIRQHFLVKPDDLSRINLAFFTFNGIASLLFGAFAISDLLL